MINGKHVRFKQTDLKRIADGVMEMKAKVENYELFTSVKNISRGGEIEGEINRDKGTLIITDDKGNSVTKTFFGECGC